jgi:hypothetical protein
VRWLGFSGRPLFNQFWKEVEMKALVHSETDLFTAGVHTALQVKSKLFSKQFGKTLLIVSFSLALILIVCLPGLTQSPAGLITADQILKSSILTSQQVYSGMTETWIEVLGGPLYKFTLDLGGYLMAIFVGWRILLILDTSDQYSKSEYTALKHLVPIIALGLVFILQINGRPVLSIVQIQARGIGNNIAVESLRYISKNIPDPMSSAAIKNITTKGTLNEKAKCLVLPTLKERDDCLNKVIDNIGYMLQPYQNEEWTKEFYNELRDPILELLNDKGSYSNNSNYVPRLMEGAGASINPLLANSIMGVLTLINVGLVYFIEISLLITAIIGPIMIGISAFPLTQSYWSLWMLGFCGLSAINICFKIVTGLTALMTLNAPITDPLVLPMILAIFSIVFALGLASGGGVVIFQGAVSATTFFLRSR